MKTVLITAYAVNPYKGSEDGTGWNITSEIAKDFKVILITRRNNVPYVQKYLAESKIAHHRNIECHGFDLSPLLMSLKKKLGERAYVFYYYLWQKRITRFIQDNAFEFDMAHSLNFHSDSQPNFLWKLGKPTYWGPIGHHPIVKTEFVVKHYAFRNLIKDKFYAVIKWGFRNLDPNFSKAVRNTDKIFVINSSIEKVIPSFKGNLVTLPAVAAEPVPITHEIPMRENQFNVLSVGRFHYMKGFDLVIEAFATFLKSLKEVERDGIRLILVGKGEEKKRLIALSDQLSISRYIDWVDWVDKAEMNDIYQTSDVFLFPSHEGAGMVVPEAMSYGLPIVCLDNCGPGELAGDAGLKVAYSDYRAVVLNLSKQLDLLYSDKELYQQMKQQAYKRFNEQFTWEKKGLEIKKHYKYAS